MAMKGNVIGYMYSNSDLAVGRVEITVSMLKEKIY